MRKRILGILLVLLCMIHLSPVASADHLSGKEGWNVAYTAGGKLESNFHTDEYSDSIKGLQPGDDITFSITLKNENAQEGPQKSNSRLCFLHSHH